MYPTIPEEAQVVGDREMVVFTMALVEKEREKKARAVEKGKVEIWKLQARQSEFSVHGFHKCY